MYWPGDFCPNGGYPVNVSGAPTSSIGGGNTVSANNDAPPPIAAGASTNVDNSGISAGNSVNATNTSAAGITHGNSTNATTSPLAIGGGPNSGSSNDERTQTTNGATGITITRPQNRANNDFLLLTVTGQGANVTSSSNICPTNNPTTWTLVDKKYVSGTVIQETFSAVQTGTGTASYAFNFFSGSCGAAPGNLTLAASAIVVRYTNVGSVDNAVGATGAPTAVNLAGAAPSTVWAAPATTSYASTINTSTTYGRTVAARYVSLSTNCTSTVNGFVSSGGCDNTPVSATGNISGFTFNFTGGAKTNGTTTYTVALYLNTNGTTGSSAATGLNCTIQTNSSGCTITGSIAVTAGQTIQLKVTRSNAGTNVIATASASATEGQAQISNYVELSTPPASCASTTVATCDTASIATPGTLASASLTFANNVPSGSYTVTLFDNGAATASACTISTGSSTCTIAGGLALAAGDNVELRVTGATGTGAFTSTATTALVESVSTLTAPAITTSQPNERIVHLFGTGSTSFATGNDVPVTVSTNSTSEGADDSRSTAAESVASTTPDNWVAQTVALIPGQPSSITLSTAAGTLPSDYQGNTGDFLLVSVSVEGFNGQVCAPANWNALAPTSSGTGATEITQATFWTTLSTANSDTFTFYPKLAGCTGATLTGAAAAVATTYNGVNVASPVVIASAGNPSGAALTAPANDTGGENEEVVNLFATGDAFSGTTPPTPAFLPQAATSGTSTNVGESAGIQQTAGSQTTQANAFTTNSATWTAQTVDLVPLLNSSITLSTLPSDYQANTGDFLLVSIAVQGFGGTVCKPAGAAGASWNALAPTSSGAGATKLTQATFWTTASTANSDTFTFYPTTSCTGTPVAAAASAVATTYNGVDVASPVTITSGGNASGGNTAAPMMATQNPTGSAFEEVVSLFATGDTFGGAAPAFLPEAQTSPSSVWANIGESAGPQQATGNQAPQATATSANSATWTAQTVDLVPLLSSTITVTPPTGYVGGGADLMLVSIAATGLGSGSICAPSSADWAPVPLSTTSPVKHTVTQGDLTQEAFYTSSSEDPTITFTFFSKPSCNGVPMNVGASAVAVTYTGVNTADPFDTPSAAPASGTGTALNPAALTTAAGDELVGLYASDASNLALTGSTILALGNGLSPSSGATNAAPGAGSHSPSTATTSLNPADWTTETIALNPLSNTGIVVQRPGPQAANDFIVVTITANGLATGNICAPDDGTWTELDNPPDRSTSGGVTTTQATYYGPRFGDSPESYLFTFQTNCSAADTALPASATAVAARFVGVNPITPIDVDAAGNQIFAPNTGAGTTVNPSPVLPNHIGDWVVGLYGTAYQLRHFHRNQGLCPYHGFTQVSAGAQSETGLCYKSLPPSGFYDPPSATTSAGKPWVTQTIALEAASGACTSCVYGLEDPTTTYNFTDYGLAIQAAETNLDNLAATRPTAQKVIVILSDGDGNITNSGIGHTPTPQPCSFGIQQAEAAEQPQPTNTVPGNTWVFTIAYGANYDQSSINTTAAPSTRPRT